MSRQRPPGSEARGHQVPLRPPPGDAFLRAVVDTLLPGDDGAPPLPTGSAAGVVDALSAYLAEARNATEMHGVLDAIARRAGGEPGFIAFDAAARTAAVRAVEAEMQGAFGRLVARALEEYYDSDPVIVAMGWRLEPPQPRGHALPPFDERLLDPVRGRARLWREP
jgi:hypothetical protein